MTQLRPALAALTTTALLGVAGCAFDPSAIPVPGTSVSGATYPVRIELANALNLPPQAKVVSNGVRVGTLRDVTVIGPTAERPGHVEAQVDISASVRLPTATAVQLRQNTLLGDIFIGLDVPVGDHSTTIPADGIIPLHQTKPALQVEDLMAGISTFLTGGSVQRIQNIIDTSNALMPADPRDTARIFGVLGANIRDMADHTVVLDEMVAGIENALLNIDENQDSILALLSEYGEKEIPADANSLVLTLSILGGLGELSTSALWMAPFLDAANAAADAFVPLLLNDYRPLDLSAPSNLNRLTALLRDKIIPFAERGPKIDVTRVTATPAGEEPVSRDVQVDHIVATLRMIGLVR